MKGLTVSQAKKLRSRKQLRPADRANIDYKMAKKLQAGLDDLTGLLIIMKTVPSKKIREGKYIEDKHIKVLFELTEIALAILEYKKVRGNSDDLYVLEEEDKEVVGINFTTGEAIRQGKLYRAKAKKIDINRAILSHDHVDRLLMNFVSKNNIEHPGMGWSHSIEDMIDEQMSEKKEQNENEPK